MLDRPHTEGFLKIQNMQIISLPSIMRVNRPINSECYLNITVVSCLIIILSIMLRFGAIFLAFPLPALPHPPSSLPIIFSYLSLLKFHLAPPLPRRSEQATSELSYRGQNALSIIKTHERNTVSEHSYASLFWPGT